MQERRDAGKEVCRKGRVQERRGARKEGAGKKSAGKEVAGKEGCRQGGIQEVRDAGKNFILYCHCFVQQS